jgi:hypothetical protein
MASISFTDATGSATLNSSWPSGAPRRFRNWVPYSRPFGEGANKLSDGQLHRFAFRTDHTASFEMPGIANSSMATLTRFLEWALSDGATFTVTTDDLASRTYTCCVAPGTEPEVTREDAGMLEYTLSLTVVNIVTTPTAMLCIY